MCGLEVGCRCVFSNTKRRRKGREGGREGGEGRKARAELRVWSADMVTSLSSPGAGSNCEETFSFLSFFFFSSYYHENTRERDYIDRPVLMYAHCSDDHNEGLFKTWPLFGSRCFPQLIMMLGCTVYMCVFFLCAQCVCVCVWTSPRGYITLYVAPCFILHCIWLKRCRSQPCSCTPSLLIETNTASLDANTLASKHMHTETYKQYT